MLNGNQLKRSQLFYALGVLAIAIVYYWMAQLGFVFAWQHTNVSAVWPPSALGFIVIFLLGQQLWPGIWLGAFLANATYFLSNPSFNLFQIIFFSSLIATGNTLEAVVSCFLLKKFVGHSNPLHKVQNILRFMLAGMVGCMLSAFIGSMSVCLSSSTFWHSYTVIWLTWLLGDFSGFFTLTPVFLILWKKTLPKRNLRRLMEFAVSLSIFMLFNWMLFNGKSIISQTHVPITYFPLALMVWLTYRFGYGGAITSILVTLYQAVEGTNHGFGPFITNNLNTSLLLLQTYIMTICGTCLILAAALYERRHAQQEVVFSEQRFRALVENSFDMIVLLNPAGVIIYSSSSTEKVLGYSKQEHEGHSMFEFIHPQDEPNIISDFSRLLSHPKEKVEANVRIKHKNGSWRWIEGTGQNLFADPAIGAIVINYRDITERKLAEEVIKNELKQATRLADIGTLAAIVAHELRTPLGVIQMASHNLKNKNKGSSQDKHLENIQKKVWEGNRIIDNLLNYSRIKMPVYESCAILDLVDECVTNLGNQFQDLGVAIEKKYKINRDFTIEADSNHIREVLINILSNAYQAIQGKVGRIELTVEKTDDEYLAISTKDDGVGIDIVDLDKIFRPFFTTKAKGTGLGLTICNELINLHHGRLDIQSVKDHGTTVYIFLPIKRKILD